MAERTRTDLATRQETALDIPGPGRCTACLDAEPDIRYTHMLDLARNHDFDAVELHLWAAFREGTKLDADRMRSYIDDRMWWLKEQVHAYSGKVDACTGAPLPWWEGRRQTILAMRASTGMKLEAAAAAREVRDVPGVSRAQRETHTPMPEPVVSGMADDEGYTDDPEED